MSHKAKIFIAVYIGLLTMLPVVIPLPAMAQNEPRNLQWTIIDKPGLAGNVVVSPSDVSEIAIGSSIFYALDVTNARIYRSMSGGLRWENITSYLGAPLGAESKIAIAPDQPAIVAVTTNGGTALFLSVDGGITWSNMHMGVAAGTIAQSIAVSKSYVADDREQRDILVGTADFTDAATTGQVLLLHLGNVVPYWRNLNIKVDPSVIGGEVSAVAFSPSYTDDWTIVVIASTGTGVAAAYQDHTYLCIGTNVDVLAGNVLWRDPPIEIPPGSSRGDGAGVINGGLALSSNFSAVSNSGMAYAFYRVDPALLLNDPSNVYQIDMSLNTVTAFTGGGTNRYSSIALSGAKLLSGEVLPFDSLTVAVRISLNANSTTPTFSYTGYPYGQSYARVAWSSSVAYCGTSGTESGFSISNDSGLNWVQVGLIDTTVLLQDVAVASSPQSIFMTSSSTSNVESVWRSAGEPLGQYWGRVLATDMASNRIIVRVSPNYRDDYTLYVCELDRTAATYSQFWVSHDRGNAWKQYNAPLGIIDLAVADKKVVYTALPAGETVKSDSGGQFWKNPVSTGLPEITMLSWAGPDTVFVGGKHGDVVYSSDGGKSYAHIPQKIIDTGTVQVIADSRYQQNSLIYAASGNTIYRWAIDKSDHWDIIRTTDASRQISGMVSVNGILYGLWYIAAGGSGAERSLDAALPLVFLEWDTIQAGAAAAKFNAAPTSLRYSVTDTSVILWAIDNNPDTVKSQMMVYFDCLAWKGPNLTMSNDAVIGCDPATGRTQEVNFTWDDICADNRYQLQVAKDANFTMMVFDSGNSYPFLLPPVDTSPALVYFTGGGSTSPLLSGIQVPALECGHTYYWRVRARAAVTDDIIRSPWSETRAFTAKAGFRVTTPYYGPQLLAPDNGCGCPCRTPAAFSWSPFKETTEYRFELSLNPDMSRPLVSIPMKTTAYQYQGQLRCNTTYFWRVRAVQPAPSEWSAVFSFQVNPEQQTSAAAVSTRWGPLMEFSLKSSIEESFSPW